jgi:hypothetical protein
VYTAVYLMAYNGNRKIPKSPQNLDSIIAATVIGNDELAGFVVPGSPLPDGRK